MTMDWMWLIKAYLIFLGASSIAIFLVSLGPVGAGITGVAFVLSAVFYDELDAMQQNMVPSYLRRFDAADRKAVDRRSRNIIRLILLLWGVLWIANAAHRGAAPLTLPSFGVLGVWFVGGLLFLTAVEALRFHVAGRSETYEQFQADFTYACRWLCGGFFVVMIALVHLVLG